MPLAITEDHRALAEVAAAMVAGRAGTAGARRILLDGEKSGRWWSTDGLWKEMVSTGWLGLHIDERFDGQGYGLPELTIVLEQLGRAAVAGPFLPTVVVSAVIAEAGAGGQREPGLPRRGVCRRWRIGGHCCGGPGLGRVGWGPIFASRR